MLDASCAHLEFAPLGCSDDLRNRMVGPVGAKIDRKSSNHTKINLD